MKAIILGAVLVLAACTRTTDAGTASSPEPATPSGAMCDAGKIRDLIGKQASAVREDARRRSGAETVRVYATGSPVTMDFRPDRLNIETDANGAIVRLSCG